jgi:rhomboid protease GluP
MLPDPSTLTSTDEEFPHCVAVHRRRSTIMRRSAVLLAKQMEHYIQRVSGGYAIFTRSEEMERAQRELALYAAEQTQQEHRPPPPRLMTHRTGWPLGVALGLGLALIHYYQWRSPELAQSWNDQWGRDTEKIITHGEWWRLVTALGLHADPIHLGSNLFFAACFGILVAMEYGACWGWLLLVLSGVLGNGLVCTLTAADSYRGIGFSTAVFGGVGLLVAQGLAYAWRWRHWSTQKAWVVPLAGGLALLGLFGSGAGDAQVDVLAHVTGFLSGIILGLIWVFSREARLFRRGFRREKIS